MDAEPLSLPTLPPKGTLLLVVAFLFAACFGVYGASLGNEFVRFDDGLLIFENPTARGLSFENVARAFTSYDPELYIPLTFLSYQIDYAIGGFDATVYHLHNLLFHALNAVLVAWLVFLLSSSGRAGILAGTFWAIHPLNAEAVAWAAALKDVQSTCFFLASIVAYLYYRSDGGRKSYWTSVSLFALGLLSKVSVITLPAVLLLLDWRNARRWTKETFVELAPFALLSVAFGIVAVFGKTAIISSVTPWETAVMAAKSTMFYVQKLLWPGDLSVLYPYDGPITLASPDFFLPALGVLALVAAALYGSRFTRDIPFAVAFYLGTLFPTFFNFSKADTFFVASDRYAYVPSIALFFLASLAVDRALSFSGRRSTVRNKTLAAGVAGIAAFVVLASATHARSLTWKNTESLFLDVLSKYPSSFIARNNLGNVYIRQERWNDAIREFEEGLKHAQNVSLYNNLARAYGRKGDVAKAEEHFRNSLGLEPDNEQTYVEFARMYAQNGLIDKASDMYDEAIELQPGYAVTYANRGSMFLNAGRRAEAIADFEKAIELDPTLPHAYYNLGLAHAMAGDVDAAIPLYEKAVELEPTFYEAHFNLGGLYAKKGRLEESRAEFVKALSIKPRNKTIENAIRQIDEALAAQKARR